MAKWIAATGSGGGPVDYADLPPGVQLRQFKEAGVWPARLTAREDLPTTWEGPTPAPSVVTSGTGGMLPNDSYDITSA